MLSDTFEIDYKDVYERGDADISVKLDECTIDIFADNRIIRITNTKIDRVLLNGYYPLDANHKRFMFALSMSTTMTRSITRALQDYYIEQDLFGK